MDSSWTLDELATETGLTPRTIRGYIERGLLAGPVTRGRGARYGERHLNRLLCIQAIKDAAPISLDAIRQVLLSLDEDRIRAIGAGEEPVMVLPVGSEDTVTSGAPSSGLSTRGRSTLDYIASVREQSGRGGRTDRGSTKSTRPSRGSGRISSGIDRLVRVLRQSAAQGTVSHKSRAEIWASIPVTPDIEIRVRGPDDHDIRRLERAADHLRHALMDDHGADRPRRPVKPGKPAKKGK